MNEIPIGVIVAVILCLVAAAALTWLRRDMYGEMSATTVWNIIEEYVAQFLLGIMIVATVVQLTTRYFLGGLVVASWAEEFALLAQVWLTFWGAAIIHRRRQHIDLQIVYDLMPRAAQRVVLILGDIVAIAILSSLAWAGFWNAKVLTMVETMSLGISVSWFAYSIPICLSLFVIYSVCHLIDHIRAPSDKPPVSDHQETFA